MAGLVPYLQLGHAAFGALLFAAYLAQGWRGRRIRVRRAAGGPPDLPAVRSHRRLGPPLAALVAVQYFGGMAVALADKQRLVAYPLHFGAGTLLVALVLAAFAASRRIRGQAQAPRLAHRVLGAAALAVFAVQVILGLRVLL